MPCRLTRVSIAGWAIMDTYSFDNFQVTITGPGGSFLLGTDGAETITMRRSGTPGTMTGGADGTVVHSLHANKSGRATIRLLRNSPVQGKLLQLYTYQRSSSTLWGKNIIRICDMGGNVISTYNGAAFVNPPMNAKCEFNVGIVDP